VTAAVRGVVVDILSPAYSSTLSLPLPSTLSLPLP
jgi:hypothetical protein